MYTHAYDAESLSRYLAEVSERYHSTSIRARVVQAPVRCLAHNRINGSLYILEIIYHGILSPL